MGKDEPFSRDRKYNTYVGYLVIMVLVLIIAIVIRLTTGMYVALDMQDIFLILLSLPLGAIFGDWLASKK